MSLGVGVPALLVGLFGDGYLHIKHAQADRYTILCVLFALIFIYMGVERVYYASTHLLLKQLSCTNTPFSLSLLFLSQLGVVDVPFDYGHFKLYNGDHSS